MQKDPTAHVNYRLTVWFGRHGLVIFVLPEIHMHMHGSRASPLGHSREFHH